VLGVFNPGTGDFPAVYVGKSSDLRRRLCEHSDRSSTSTDIAAVRVRTPTYFSAAPVSRPELRSAIESALIGLLRPPCNRQVPAHPRVFPNLPPWIPLYH
jgi:hypothetical protein